MSKNEKLSRSQKKAIKKTMKKWVPGAMRRNPKVTISALGGAGMSFFVGLDLLITGGSLTALGIFLAALIGAETGMGLASLTKNHQNKAKQIYRAPVPVNIAVFNMETKLQKAFNNAAAPNVQDRPAAQRKLVKLAEEIGADLKTLTPLIEVRDGGPHGFGVDLEIVATLHKQKSTEIYTLSDIVGGKKPDQVKKFGL